MSDFKIPGYKIVTGLNFNVKILKFDILNILKTILGLFQQ
jgi:hypothetical protein